MSSLGLDECDSHSQSPSSPRLDRLSMKSDSPSESSVAGEDKSRGVVVALMASLLQPEEDVRSAAASSLALIAQARPLLVLTEWHSAFSKQKQLDSRQTTSRKSSASIPQLVPSSPHPCVALIKGMGPVMEYVVGKSCLDAGDVRHRAVLGQIMATLVEEMVTRMEVQVVARDILVGLAGGYMDKVMDVLLVQFQPNTVTVHPVVVSTLGSLAKHHPHGSVPFLKAILSTTAHLVKSVKVSDIGLRVSFAEAVSFFCDALLDYVSNISMMPDSSVTLAHYNTEADTVYDQLFSSWLPVAKEKETKLAIMTAIACTTPLISDNLMKDKSTQYITTLLGLYKKLAPSLGSSLEITLCLSPLLELLTSTSPTLLEPVLDPVFNTMFQQVCCPPDYTKQNTVKNHNEILRCYDTMMKHFPAKLVSGLLNKVDSSEERVKIGALTVVRHLLNMKTEDLGERLEEIFNNISSRLGETNMAVQKVMAQIIVLLGHHGTVTGKMGRDCVEFIIRLCAATEQVELHSGAVATESLGEMCSNILQLLTTSVPSVEAVLWPHTLEYFFDTEAAENENWFKAVKLLSVLYNALLRNIVPGLMPFLLDTFLRSIEPYFNIIQVWLTEGRLEDWSQEFIFYKDNEPLDEEDDFWNNMFKSHDYKGRLADESIVPLRLLEGLDQKIFVSGKSIEILSKLDHLLNGKFSVKFDEENNNRILFVDFVQNLESQLPKIVKDPTPTKPDVAADLSPEYQAIVRSAEDPYLALAFEEVFKTIQTSILSNTTTLCPPPPSLLLSNSSLDLLMPLEPIMKRSLSPTITSHYTRACSTLVTLFMSDLNLESVLSRARRVFFMEAGDLMHDFCTQLFHLLDRGSSLEIADSASLTLLLQDCLGGRYPSWCDQFSCSYSPPQEHSATPSLDGLNIHLSVPWPLTILLSQHNLDIYNKVFIFLAGVKRSLWALQSVRLSTLAHLEENMEGLADLSSTSQSFADNSLPLGVKQHRLQLLRSWLLYFTTTMHGYFMSRVVHSTELELKEQLQTATDLDMILATHQTYLQRIYDRCFLHPSASMLREAVVMVLGIGLELQQAASSDLPIHTRTLTAWEEKYARCHKFLATTLQAMTAKRKLPHLDGLAIALLHSCPV